MEKGKGGVDKELNRVRQEVSLSAFSILYSEMVQYCLYKSKRGYRIEDCIHEMGLRVGYKLNEYLSYRNKTKRSINILSILTFISKHVWKYLFQHSSDLLKSQDNIYEYMICDKNMILNKYINVPKDYGNINCASFAAGIVEGFLCSSEFQAEVTAHTVSESDTESNTTIFIKFYPEVKRPLRSGTVDDKKCGEPKLESPTRTQKKDVLRCGVYFAAGCTSQRGVLHSGVYFAAGE
ncbi:trafficking protein particle complex subunit 5, putative (TRAPPC5) [Plasmodium ovale wallikeri]|uniref:Trafficking protein particle complex subunit 5, putative (TRAPPC5) n=1 Tax=Plasmodium ovale wallikeri TaxID=864142 RepID=A0A1A8ZMR3_PLAOA|nr:trafficking protein particle complex subunit 5, putative (TRAPPC5) [Plasmodium ovale wallikeri]